MKFFKIKSLLSIILIMMLLSTTMIFFPNEVNAVTRQTELEGQWFYIKNAYSGMYLDVPYANANNGTNIWQCKFTNDNAQKWYVIFDDNGECEIFSRAGATESDGTLYLNYCLDISDGINENGTNLQLWGTAGVTAQKFGFTRMADSSYKITTACSNHEKVITVQDQSCEDGANVHQWTYTGAANERWFLEPVEEDTYFGLRYVLGNINTTPTAFPDLSYYGGGETANFSSQALLNSGIHYDNSWYIYRKNSLADRPSTESILREGWLVADNSPWIDENEFKNHFGAKAVYLCQGVLIKNSPDRIMNMGFSSMDIVQVANLTSTGSATLSNLDSIANLIITGQTDYNGTDTYDIMYKNANGGQSDNIIELATQLQDAYFVFYKF